MDPVWTLFSRRTYSRLAYWLSALGYDLRDRSLSNRVYLLYFCLFWLVWATAIFALLGGLAAQLIITLQWTAPDQEAAFACSYLLALWVMLTLWQVTRRSPFVFREEDAYLLCQTPVDRRKVGLAWYLQGWLGTTLPFAAGTVVLAFGLSEWRLQGDLTIFHIFDYLQASLQALSIVLPLQAGLQAGLWSLGALRLHGQNDPRGLRLAAPVFALLLVGSYIYQGFGTLLLAPLYLPLAAAFESAISVVDWTYGMVLALIFLGGGLAALWKLTRQMHLGRAAQETSRQAARQAAEAFGAASPAEAERVRSRLGAAHKPSKLPGRSGAAALLWKNVNQALRSLSWIEAGRWGLILGASLGMFLPTNWGLQLVMSGLWAIGLGSLAVRRLCSDLARWWLLRSLPIASRDLLRTEFSLPWFAAVFLGWLALVMVGLPLPLTLMGLLLIPFLAAAGIYATVYDILRHARARTLMSPSLAEENVPSQNIGGVIQALISILIPFGLWIAAQVNLEQGFWAPLGVAAAVLSAVINEQMALAEYKHMR